MYSHAALEPACMLSFLLTLLDWLVTARTSIQEAAASSVSSFDPFLSMMESSFLLPASCWDVCVRGGGTQALTEFIINTFLSWGLDWSWSVYLLSCSFKDLTTKAASPPKPLSFPHPPHSCSATPGSSRYARSWLHLLIFASELAEVCLPMSLMVIMDGKFAAYLFPSSAHLASHCRLCSRQSDRSPGVYFSFRCTCAYLSLSQITLMALSKRVFLFLLTEISFSLTCPQVQIRVLLQSCSEFWRYQREGWGLSPKPLQRLFASLFTFRVHSCPGWVKPPHFPNR